MPSPDLLVKAQRIYEAYQKACDEFGWQCMRPLIAFEQQAKSIKKVWAKVAQEI